MTNLPTTAPEAQISINRFTSRVYLWMLGGLSLTGIIASNATVAAWVLENEVFFYVIIGAKFLLVWWFRDIVERVTAETATIIFLLYSMLSGLTLSGLFFIYTSATLSSTFFITAGTFGLMSLYGYSTKTDLTSVGNIAFMGLMGIILASVVNIFLDSSGLYWLTTYIGVLVFVGLTAYDAQKIKDLASTQEGDTEESKKESIIAALSLYLDFIGLFIFFLRLFATDND